MKREEKERSLFLLEVWADLPGLLRAPERRMSQEAYSETPRALTSHVPHPVHPATLCSALLREGDWEED